MQRDDEDARGDGFQEHRGRLQGISQASVASHVGTERNVKYSNQVVVPEGNILIGRAAACWPLNFGSRGCAAKCKTIGALSHNPSKGPQRVSWNAAHIAVKPTRVCVALVLKIHQRDVGIK